MSVRSTVPRAAAVSAALFAVLAAVGPPAAASNGQAGDHASGTSGTVGISTEPQPFSTADMNETGANTTSSSNPYLSTRSGLPSLNGSTTGQAVAEPCAGCVGRADNKFPLGQAPDASDANRGYECDTNHGIAQTNPAHTGCTLAGLTTLKPPSVAPTSVASVEVLGAMETRRTTPAVAGPEVLGVNVSRAPAAFARTGAATGELTAIGFGMILLGAGACGYGRRRPRPA